MTTTTPPAMTTGASRELITVLRAAKRTGIAACLWSDPGTGKSSLIRAAAQADGVACETVIGSLREPTDFAGLPVVTTSGVDLAPPSWAKRLADPDHPGGYLFLDEISTAPPAVQAAMLSVVLDRQVGDIRLPASVGIVAAANPPERAADGWDLAPPMANRLLHIDYDPTVQEWLDGISAGFPLPAPGRVLDPSPPARAASRASVAAFIKNRPNLLHAYPDTDAATGRAWPSRRTWTMAADLMAALDPNDDASIFLAVTGLVGIGAATEYMTYRRTLDLADPKDVLDDPAVADWTSLTPDRAWALLTAVAALAADLGTKTAWEKAWKALAAAADHNLADVAAASAGALMRSRPVGAKPPAAVKRFTTHLADAGLLAA